MDIQVVVPVVARKKGMDEFYTSADGRQKKRPPSRIPEPVRDLVRVYTVREADVDVVPPGSRPRLSKTAFKAPGTFGYDYSKYRPQLEDETIPMTDTSVGYNEEVGSPTERGVPSREPHIDVRGEARRESKGESADSEEHVRMRIQPSPAPFSRYQASHEDHEGRSRLPAGLTTADIKPHADSGQGRRVHGEEEEQDGAGCCKCIIM